MVAARQGERRAVYDPRGVDGVKGEKPLLSSSYMTRLLGGYVPDMKGVVEKLCAEFPDDATEILAAWFHDRRDEDRAAASAVMERVRPAESGLLRAQIAAPAGGAPSVHAALADRTAAALGDKAADLAVVLELVRKIAPYWDEAGPIVMHGLQAAEGVARAHERAAAAGGAGRSEKGKAGA